jgi:integrase
MLTYSKDGLTIAISHDTRRALLDGTFPVKIRATYNRKIKYYATGKSLTSQEWSILWTTRNKELSSIRKDIENSFDIIKEAAEELLYAGDFSFERLNVRLRHSSEVTINGLFRERVEELKRLGRMSNADIHFNTLSGIERFDGRAIPLERITPRWLTRYSASLADEGKAQTTIAIHLRTLRSVVNQAIKDGLMRPSDYPFGRGKFEIQEGEGRKLALSIEQIGQIANYDDGDPLTYRYRDMWLFIYLCNGINVADLAVLRYRDIVGGEIRFVRQKTAHTTRKRKEIVVVVGEQMQRIIDKWGNPPHPNAYIFPILSGGETPERQRVLVKNATRAINQRMAKVGKTLGLGNISTYTARHSFATVLKRAGANIAYISESLGHTDLKTTEHYLASFEREEREKNAALLTQW